MSKLKFTHKFNKTAADFELRKVHTDTAWGDCHSSVIQEIPIHVPCRLMSHVFSFKNTCGGRLKLDFLPLKEYLDVLDCKLKNTASKMFLNDEKRKVTNLEFASSKIKFINDPLASLPASFIKDTSIHGIITEDLFTTFSEGPVDTAIPNPDFTYYDSIRNLFDQAVAYGMITDNLNALYPFSDMYAVRFKHKDSLSIRVNYTITKTRKYEIENCGCGDIVIGGLNVNINPDGYSGSVMVSYTIIFIADSCFSYFPYHIIIDNDRDTYDLAVYSAQIINHTSSILRLVSLLDEYASVERLKNGLFAITTLKNAYNNAVDILAYNWTTTFQLYTTGFNYIKSLLDISKLSEVTTAYNTLYSRVMETGTTQTIGIDFSDEIESLSVTIVQPIIHIKNTTTTVILVFPDLPCLIPTFRYGRISIELQGMNTPTVVSTIDFTGTNPIIISGYNSSKRFTVTLSNLICENATLNLTGELVYISPGENEQCEMIQAQKDKLLKSLSDYFSSEITKSEFQTSLSNIKKALD